MTKRPLTGETLVLALELLKRIPRTRKITARQLHEQLPESISRDLRTVQRQLETLSETFEIECDDSSKPYGYRWKERATGLSLPTLTDQESLLLTLAEQHLRNLLPADLMKSMAGFFSQARRRLDPLGSAKLEREWLSKVRVVSQTQPLLAPRIAPGVFETVSNALYADRWLLLEYKNAAGRAGPITVMPLGLAQQGPRLYLVCRYEGFDNERSLAVHRIINAKLGATFVRPRDFDLKSYDDDGRFGLGAGVSIKLRFVISKSAGLHLLESRLSADQQVVETPESYQITATVIDSEWLWRWVRGFGRELTDVTVNGLPVSPLAPHKGYRNPKAIRRSSN